MIDFQNTNRWQPFRFPFRTISRSLDSCIAYSGDPAQGLSIQVDPELSAISKSAERANETTSRTSSGNLSSRMTSTPTTNVDQATQTALLAIHALFHDPDAQAKKRANEWLSEFQHTVRIAAGCAEDSYLIVICVVICRAKHGRRVIRS